MANKRKRVNSVRWGADEVIDRLAKRYCAPEWAFFPQARNSTGYQGQQRYADALAMNLWPSRGLSVHGFEVKVNRGDWLNEMRDPAKSSEIQRYCDYWWLVIGDEFIVQDGELPQTWGLLVAEASGIRHKREAPTLESVPLDRGFIASLLRNAAELPNKEAKDEYGRGLLEGRAARQGEVDDAKAAILAFEKASGIRIREEWGAGKIGATVSIVMGLRHNVDAIAHAAKHARRIADGLESIIDESKLRVLATQTSDLDE